MTPASNAPSVTTASATGNASGCLSYASDALEADPRPLLVLGQWQYTRRTSEVRDPDDGRVVAVVCLATADELETALAGAPRALAAPWPAGRRAVALMLAADHVAAAADDFTSTIAREGVKTLAEARAEVARAVQTLRLSAGAAFRGQPASAVGNDRPGSDTWAATVQRQPVGVVAAITPFNDPLNLVAHKVGPALAAGNAVIVKPDPRTPLSALHLADVLIRAGVPQGRLSVLPAGADLSSALVADPRVRFVSFTGGRAVGTLVHRDAGPKRLLLELGGICPTIVMDDADPRQVVPALLSGAFAAAGQNCLHVQRILIHSAAYDVVRDALVAGAARLSAGPKTNASSDLGPLIDQDAVDRVHCFVTDAVTRGARLLCGGTHRGPYYSPTLLEHVPSAALLAQHEVFGPVTTLESFDTVDQAITQANRGDGAIHAGVFTNRRDLARTFAERLDVGGVVLGGTSDHRSDALPFGGTGRAGIGREGVTWAANSMTELKTILDVA